MANASTPFSVSAFSRSPARRHICLSRYSRFSKRLLHEETRHIVFFINWMAWEQARRGRGAAWLRAAVAARLLHARDRPPARHRPSWPQRRMADKDFSATQASIFLDGFTLRGLVEECCAEHARRMREFDPELLQPRFLPRLAGDRARRLAAAPRTVIRERRDVKLVPVCRRRVLGLALIAALVIHFGAGAVARSLLARRLVGFTAICLIHLALIAVDGDRLVGVAAGDQPVGADLGPARSRFGRRGVAALAGRRLCPRGAGAIALPASPATAATASTIVDVTLEFFAQLAYIAIALFWLLHLRPRNARSRCRSRLGLGLAAALAAGFLIAQRRGFDLARSLRRARSGGAGRAHRVGRRRAPRRDRAQFMRGRVGLWASFALASRLLDRERRSKSGWRCALRNAPLRLWGSAGDRKPALCRASGCVCGAERVRRAGRGRTSCSAPALA